MVFFLQGITVCSDTEQQQIKDSSGLIGKEIPRIAYCTRLPQRGEDFPDKAAEEQIGNCLLPGSDRVAPAQSLQQIQPGRQGQARGQIVGIAG